MTKIRLSLLVVGLLWGVAPTHAQLTIREVFDNPGANVTLNGQSNFNGTSVGFASGSSWTTNPGDGSAANVIFTSSSNLGSLPGLSPDAGSAGSVTRGGANYSTNIWATRQLDSTTALNLGANGTTYFSFRLNNAGDTAAGFGFSNGNSSSSQFIGWGGHWGNAADLVAGNASDSLYYSSGTLGQDLLNDNNGPYTIIQHTTAHTLDGSALIVGMLATSSSGSDIFSVKMYFNGETVPTDPSGITWDMTTGASSSTNLNYLLLWINGNGTAGLDAFRAGGTWGDVVVAAVPEPSTYASLFGIGALGFAAWRRSRRVRPRHF